MRHLPDVLAVIGATLIVSGVAMMHAPSAVILGGIATVLAGRAIHEAQK